MYKIKKFILWGILLAFIDKIKMIPQWNMADTGVPIYGSTKGKGDDDYITISSSDTL